MSHASTGAYRGASGTSPSGRLLEGSRASVRPCNHRFNSTRIGSDGAPAEATARSLTTLAPSLEWSLMCVPKVPPDATRLWPIVCQRVVHRWIATCPVPSGDTATRPRRATCCPARTDFLLAQAVTRLCFGLPEWPWAGVGAACSSSSGSGTGDGEGVASGAGSDSSSGSGSGSGSGFGFGSGSGSSFGSGFGSDSSLDSDGGATLCVPGTSFKIVTCGPTSKVRGALGLENVSNGVAELFGTYRSASSIDRLTVTVTGDEPGLSVAFLTGSQTLLVRHSARS